ncbi:MbtH family protein [Streptomyces chattanoogensis]
MQEPHDSTRVFRVVANDERQYSLWRAGRALPAGWHATGFEGPHEACLRHIAEVWTDLRPLTLRDGAGA